MSDRLLDIIIVNGVPTLPPLSDAEAEARYYYRGLPSTPRLVARTGPPWDIATSLKRKQLRIVGTHGITKIWEALAPKVCDTLNEGQVDWTSVDLVRIGFANEPPGPVVLWIGIDPDSHIPHEVNDGTAARCKALLMDHNIKDVEVEMRRSNVTQLVGPQLFQPADFWDPTAQVRLPFTPTSGIPVSSQSTPWAEGTGGFFLNEGSDGKRLFLVTTRHVVLPGSDNESYEPDLEGEARRNVVIFSDSSFKRHLTFITDEINKQNFTINLEMARIDRMVDHTDDKERQNSEHEIEEAKEKIKALTDFHHELSTQWARDDIRVLGHIFFSPPMAIGANQYTCDIAVIAVDASKIDPTSFRGNVIDLGVNDSMAFYNLSKMMNPNPRKLFEQFECPSDGLLPLHGTITEEEMLNPHTYDSDGQFGIMVLKRGKTTGLTVGRANNVFSYARCCIGKNKFDYSKEWAILPFDRKSGAFSAPGDSGSAVVDGAGQIGGLITSGSGFKDFIDVTYVTPISFILETIHSNKTLANAYLKSWHNEDNEAV